MLSKLISAAVQGAISALLAPVQAWLAQRAAKAEGAGEQREETEDGDLKVLEKVTAPSSTVASDSLWNSNKARFGSVAGTGEPD